MAEITASIDINAPPEAIWALMCDPHRYPDFAEPTDRMVSVPDAEFGVGYVYKEEGGIPPFKGESTWRVTEFEPMRRQAHVGDDGSMTFDLSIELDPIDTGTHLTQGLKMTPRWYISPVSVVMWPLLMRKRAQTAMDKTVENVKRLAESAGSESGAAGSA